MMKMDELLPVIDSCTNCGACCVSQESPPMYLYYLLNPESEPDAEDAVRVRLLPESLKEELLQYNKLIQNRSPHPNDGICLWFDEETRQCKHHDLRPSICREFEIGSVECRDWRNDFGVE